MRALIVDDEPLVALGIETAVRTRGVEVVARSQCGRDLLAALGSEDIELLFIGMPQDIAPEVLVAKVQAVRTKPIRVIALLSSPRREQLVQLLHLGVDAITLRSVTPDGLAAIVERVWRGERYVAPAVLPILSGDFRVGESQPAAGGLTARELEVLGRLAEGMSGQDIAATLYISLPTVKTHLSRIYTKLGVGSRSDAVGRAVALRLLH
jgi:DNA-binding NarL/FixJ family response regulator